MNVIKKIINTWKEIQSERLGTLRNTKENSKESMGIFLSNHETFNNYTSVLSYINEVICKKMNELNSKNAIEQTRVFIIKDKTSVQGMCATTLKTNSVYINGMVSAPWNIQMDAEIAPEYQNLRCKGIGKELIAAVYKLAFELGKTNISLTPSFESFNYYKHIGMNFNEKECIFSFDVTEKVPQSLQTKKDQ